MRKCIRKILATFVLLGLTASLLNAEFTDCATDWNNFDSPGFLSEYTYQGQTIADEETSADSSHGSASVTPSWTDLSSGSPGAFPGPEPTAYFGYYNGGTVYDPDDPATMEDDYIMFRMRVGGDPRTGAAFDSKHWNVLFDVDGDGYKEYWVDLDGAFNSGQKADRLQILYDDATRQDITDPDAARVEAFTALNAPDGDPSCGAGSPGLSHTRVLPVDDGTGDYWIDLQIPMTAFNDGNGNQVLFPDSPVAFVFSTGASNQDPLQKDFMHDLDFLTLADPITFGDIIIPNGRPLIEFTDVNLDPVSFYSVGEDVYIYLTDPSANTDSNTVECIEVTVTDPATGDDERLTLCESSPSSGIFTNKGGACKPAITNPSPAPQPPTAWITGVTTSATTIDEDWTVTYDAGTDDWIVTGSVSGVQAARASHGVSYTSDNGEVSFTLYQDDPAGGTEISFCTLGADPLPTSSASGTDDDGVLQVASGDDIFVSYTSPNSITVTDTAAILGACEAFISFTRATGLPSTSFQLESDPATSDQLYVTVFHSEANTDPAVAESISVVLTGNDTQTLTLTETGPDTGEFRNTSGLATQIDDGTVTPEDDLWEDVDTGVVTATYDYACGGSAFSVDTEASLFYTEGGGRVAFTNGAGTSDVELYGANQPVWIQVTDANACDSGGTLPVTVASAAGDSESLTLYETFPGSGVYMNRRSDLVTTAGSAVVTSASSTFLTDGVQAGDIFAIATGPDIGTYTVASVDSETQITLTAALGETRTGIGFSATPLMTATSDGAIVTDDGLLEAEDQDVLTVSYADCDDGDSDASNDVKIDVATYNAPALVINEVLFYPDTSSSSCQTEAVELFNASSVPVNATGYTVTDEDGFSYVVPQLDGADIVLLPGETIYLSLWDASPPNDFFLNGTYYLFTAAGTTFPSDRFADPASGDPADQVLLFDSFGVVQDYVGWSATLSPSLDFYGDDSPAVLRSIWQDDAFKDVSGMSLGASIARSSDGFDTNQPSDWEMVANDTCQVIATRAFVSSFRAFRERRGMVVEWQTSSENGTLGFYLFRLHRSGKRYVQVTKELVPALLDAPQGGIYRAVDRDARDEEPTYVLLEIEAAAAGTSHRFHGPYTVSVEQASSARRAVRIRGRSEEAVAHAMSLRERARSEAREREGRRRRVSAKSPGIGGRARMKILVVEDGLHAVGAAELASGFGVSEAMARRWLSRGLVRLTNRGRPVAWTSSDDGSRLLFWGEAIDSIYTRENVYWLESGRGVQMTAASSKRRARRGRASAPEAGAFLATIHLEEDRFAATLVSSDPESDYWYWSYVASGHPSFGKASFPLEVAGLSGAAVQARLAVRLFSATDTSGGTREDHHVRVRLNGHLVGEDRFAGIGNYVLKLSFDQRLLHEGDNTVEVEGVLDTGAPFSIFYVDSFDLSYERAYRAFRPSFVFRADGNRSVSVSGLSGSEVTVLEITDPLRPRLVTEADVVKTGDSYVVSFETSGSAGIYAAATPEGIVSPAASWKKGKSTLRSPASKADYLVIAPAELEAGAESLAALRRSQGLEARVVDLEEVIEEFNHGISSPHAVREFLAFTHEAWARAPRFVVLAGAGSFDYKDHLGLGANLVPPLMVGTGDGLYASDNRFGDVDKDGWPEMAVGRLPVMTSSELESYVQKLAAYEASGSSLWNDRLLLVADDDPWTSANFEWDTESMAAAIPKSLAPERVYLSVLGPTAARGRVLSGLSEGAALVNYVGHGGLDRLADEAVLHTSDVPGLGNGERLAILTGFSCSINRFELAGFQSLGEALTLEPGGGAAAVWAPSGLSQDKEARALGSAFFETVFQKGQPTLGDAILSSFRAYRAEGGSKLSPLIYNLLGDPATRLK